MARTSIRANYNDLQTTNSNIEKILKGYGYKLITENGESVWKSGVGFLTAMKYIKIEFATENELVISGWIRAVAGSEMALKGFFGALPKKQVMNVIKKIQAALV